ncbi:hypothetical protein FHG87_013102, partial [Trinorchestia longiramus]
LSSIFSSALITQPIKIYLTAMIFSWICRRPLEMHDDIDDDEDYHELDWDVELLHAEAPPGDGAAEQKRKKKRQVGSGISPEALEAAKKRRKNQVAMNKLLMDLAVYLVFVTIIGTISYSSTDFNVFLQNQHFKNSLATPLGDDGV